MGVKSVHWHPELGLVMVKIDLRSLAISIEHAAFIDLDITQTLNLEIKLNMQRLSFMSAQEMERMTFRELYSNNGIKELQF